MNISLPGNHSLANATGLNSTAAPLNPYDVQPAPWWALLLMILLILLTVSTNAVILIAFYIDRTILLKEPFNCFLLNLSINDFLTGAVAMPQFATLIYLNYWPFTYRHCTFWIFFDALTTGVCLVTVTVISIDRLWAVSVPVLYRSYNSTRKVAILVIFIWVYNILSFAPAMLYYRTNTKNPQAEYECSWDVDIEPAWTSTFYAGIAQSWVPLCIVFITYPTTLFVFVKQTQSRKRVVKPESKDNEKHDKKERRIFYLLTLLFICLLVCYVPPQIVFCMTYYLGANLPVSGVATYWLAYAMACFNPFLFHAASPAIRRSVNRVLRCGRKPSKKKKISISDSRDATRTVAATAPTR